MAKLYWRVKKNGRWTFVSAGVICELSESDWIEGGEVTVILNGRLPEGVEQS